MGQFLTRQARQLAVVAIAAAALGAGIFLGRSGGPGGPGGPGGTGAPPPAASGVPRGGDLRVAVRTDPQSFNWYTSRDATTNLVTLLTQARLVRINRVSQDPEPWLASGWTRSDDGRQYTIALRPGVVFADGHPFTAGDVVFSLETAYAAKAGSTLGDSLQVGGRRLAAEAPDPLTVVVTFPEPFGPGLRLFDNLPILPKHKLQRAVAEETFGEAWGPSTPVAELTGLGPFVLSEYSPGQRLVFTRNARYFRTDADGSPLPYLDRVIFDIVPDQDTEILRLQAGQSDMSASEIRPEDYAPIKRAADAGQLQLFDLGVGLDPDGLWFNLAPGAFDKDPRRRWLQRVELRRAISLAVDRRLFADTVFLGAGVPVFGPVTPGNRKWHAPALPETPHDPAAARTLLATIGLTDRDGDGTLEDAAGTPARFTVMTQRGQTAYERGAAVLRDELKKIGLTADVAVLEGNALVQRFLSRAGYDAIYFRLLTSDTDPALVPDFWLSSGYAHVWHLGQKTPATAWEGRIDELMARQAAALDEGERKALFEEVQRIFAGELPIIHFVAPRIFAAASTRVVNLQPALQRPQLVWSPDTLAVKR